VITYLPTGSGLKHVVGLRIRRSTCKALPLALVTQRLPRPSAYQQVKLRQSWSPGLWKTSSVGTDASVRAGWLNRPSQHQSSRFNVISVCRETFQASIFSAYAPLPWRSSTWHGTTDHRASRKSAARTLLSRRLHIAYFVQPRPPYPCASLPLPRWTTPQPRSASSINTTAALHLQDDLLERLAHPDSLTPASIWTGISPQPFEIG
jgi:hypothetical protein